MKGPLNVIRRRHAERPDDGVETEQAATEAPTEAHPTASLGPAPPSAAAGEPSAGGDAERTGEATDASGAPDASGATAEVPAGADVPAGQEPVPSRPSFRERGRLRRRLRYLRRVRELGFRDLGGLVFDQHKFSKVNEELVRGKLHALAAVDGELRALEHALDDRRPLTELREPGISVCARCGALHGSEARYCPSCGVPVHGPRAIAEVGEHVSVSVGEIGAVTPPAASTPPPPAEEPAPAEPEEPTPAEADQPAADGPDEQPTQAMTALDDAPDDEPRPTHEAEADNGAVPQPTGERREP